MSGSSGQDTSPGTSTGVHGNTFTAPMSLHTGSGNQYNYFAAADPGWRAQLLAVLPAERDGFVGREAQVGPLLAGLSPVQAAGVVVISAVGGLAGVGKSALALHVARRAVAEGWFHGAVWCDLRGYDARFAPLEAGGVVAKVLRSLGVGGDLPPTAEEQLAVYHTVLERLGGQGRRVLLVFDNVAHAGQVEPLLPGHDAHRTVVTSRRTLGTPRARLLDLDVLSVDEAVLLLATALREARPDDPRALDEAGLAVLAGLCGGLPLALKIVVADLRASPKLSLGLVAQQVAQERTRLAALEFPDSALRVGMRAALSLSYERLTADQARMLRLLAVDPGPDIATDAAAVLADLPPARAERLLFDLDGANLVSCGEQGRWGMHDLVRLYAREQAQTDPDEHDRAFDRLLEHYLATSTAAKGHLRALPGQPGPAGFAGRQDALDWLDANRSNLLGVISLAVDAERLDVAMRLPFALTDYFNVRRRFADWIETHTVAVDAARTLGNQHTEGMALNNLSIALRQVRRFEEAIDAGRQAAAIFRAAGDRHREGMVLNNLGNALREVRRFEEAIDAHHRDIEICRETRDRHGQGTALNNLGSSLREVRRFEEAIDAHQEAAAIYQETGDRHGESIALNNLGIALREVRRFDEAIDAHHRDLKICQEAGDRHGEGMALNNLGNALQGVQRFEEAIDAHQEAAAIYQDTGDRHGEGMALNNHGNVLRLVQRFEEAIDAQQRAAAIYQQTGDRHGEGKALHNLGLVFQQVQRIGECREAWLKAYGLFTALNAQDDAAAVRRLLDALPET